MNKHLIYSGASSQLVSILEQLTAQKIILFKSNTSFSASGAWDKLQLDALESRLIEYPVPPGLPSASSLEIAAEFITNNFPDVIIAVGGGRVIDTAKAARALCYEQNIKNNEDFEQPALIVVPTTAGTGSEVTPFATYYEGYIKKSMDKPYLIPEISIVDAELTNSLTSYQAACSNLDAICQSIESLWAKSATKESQTFAWEALELAYQHVDDSIHKRIPAANEAMTMAAHLSGRAIAISRTTAPHALSYWLTAKYDIPHGQAVGVFMGPILQLHANGGEEIPDSLQSIQAEILKRIGINKDACIQTEWQAFMQKMGLDSTLAQLNIPESEIDAILSSVNQTRMSNHPALINDQQLKMLLLGNNNHRKAS